MFSNIAAEFGLLAGLCNNPDVYFKLQQYLSADDFTDKTNRNFFTVLQRFLLSVDSSQEIIVTLPGLLAEASALGFKDFYEECGEGELIESALEQAATASDAARSFSQVKNATVKRKYYEQFKLDAKYLKETSDDTNKIIDRIDNGLIKLSNNLQGVVDDEIIHLPDRAEQIIRDLADNPGELGVNVGLPTWQRAIGGIRNGSITFIAATAKAGKSQLGARAAVELSKHIPVLYCDSELNEMSQSVRAFGMFSEINYEILETGYWKADPQKILADGYDRTFATACQIARTTLEDKSAWEDFRSRKLFYKKMTGMTAREMLPFMRRWVMQHVGIDKETRTPKCLIVWDYIKLARIDEVQKMGVGAHDVIGDTCMALHDFAEEFNLPILAFGQTNRQLDIDINMIAGAKKIVELVDSISLWKKKDADDLARDPNGTHEMYELATRHGKGLSSYVNIQADLGIGKFKELGIGKPQMPQTNNNNNDPAQNKTDQQAEA